MKNLKISAKIMAGFGVVLFLMLLIAGAVFATSMGTISYVKNIETESALQTQITNMIMTFKDARRYANVLNNVISNESYDKFEEKCVVVEKQIADAYEFISKNPTTEKYKSNIQEFEVKYGIWRDTVRDIQSSNIRLTDIQTQSGVSAKTVDGMIDGSVQKLIEMGATATTIINANTLTVTISELQDMVTHMMDVFDISQYDKIEEFANNASTILTNAVANAVGAKKENYQKVLEEVNHYNDLVKQYAEETAINLDFISQAAPKGDDAQIEMDECFDALDVGMNDQVAKTSSASVSAMVTVFIIIAVSVISAIALAVLVSGMISKPIVLIRNLMIQAADTGSFDLEPDKYRALAKFAGNKDEVGGTIHAFDKLIKQIKAVSNSLQLIADGDLTHSVIALSPKDELGSALVKMQDNLNNMFGEINNASALVAIGSNQIADGSQLLAQGSTEQASAVETLSNSIGDIAQKTEENAAKATKAANLTGSIRTNAQKGSVQMDQMMNAVKDINEASQHINKVIKVIDDIAFQTNILALNAAVEAARAGTHGKGFAVVAEEVRNLAAKSASAAKDTGSLIANSMEKAALGAKIADETAASLVEIVAGINESTDIINEIAESSGEQSQGIKSLNAGIEQVAQVIHQNSATAEESAAAAEELSSQSTMLKELVSEFKIKE